MYRTRMASFFSLLTALAFFPLGAAKLREVKDYFLAADPGMRSASTNHGTGASSWGIWRVDPGACDLSVRQSLATVIFFVSLNACVQFFVYAGLLAVECFFIILKSVSLKIHSLPIEKGHG